MERPVFSSAKRKRLRPIEPVSPAGEVFPTLEFGMATIWDAGIPIRAASSAQASTTGRAHRGAGGRGCRPPHGAPERPPAIASSARSSLGPTTRATTPSSAEA